MDTVRATLPFVKAIQPLIAQPCEPRSAGHLRAGDRVTGVLMASIDQERALIRVGTGTTSGLARSTESARVLVALALEALRDPGLPRSSVFTGSPEIYAYSADPADPSRLIREAHDGSRSVGRLLGGRWIPDGA